MSNKLSEAKQFLYDNTTSKIEEFDEDSVEAMAGFMEAYAKHKTESLEKQLEELGKHNGELERELHYLPKKHELEIKNVIYDITYCDGIEIPTVLEKLRELNQKTNG